MILASNYQHNKIEGENIEKNRGRKQKKHTHRIRNKKHRIIDNRGNTNENQMGASKSSPLTKLYTRSFRRLKMLKFQKEISLY